MDQRLLVLLQKDESPMAAMAQQVTKGMELWKGVAPPPLPPQTFTPQALVLWDLYAYNQTETEEISQLLSQDSAGVVISCSEVDEDCRRVLSQTGALGLVVHNQGPETLAAGLEVAWAIHQRLSSLLTQKTDLEQQLADRLLVEKAKRLLMEAQGFSEKEAHNRLQRHARNRNLKLVEAARGLLAGYKAFGQDQDK